VFSEQSVLFSLESGSAQCTARLRIQPAVQPGMFSETGVHALSRHGPHRSPTQTGVDAMTIPLPSVVGIAVVGAAVDAASVGAGGVVGGSVAGVVGGSVAGAV